MTFFPPEVTDSYYPLKCHLVTQKKTSKQLEMRGNGVIMAPAFRGYSAVSEQLRQYPLRG